MSNSKVSCPKVSVGASRSFNCTPCVSVLRIIPIDCIERFLSSCASQKMIEYAAHQYPSCSAGSTQNHWPFPRSHIATGYAYIITHPGMPCLQWEHVFDDGHYNILVELLAIRRKCRINMSSKVVILCADADMCALQYANAHTSYLNCGCV